MLVYHQFNRGLYAINRPDVATQINNFVVQECFPSLSMYENNDEYNKGFECHFQVATDFVNTANNYKVKDLWKNYAPKLENQLKLLKTCEEEELVATFITIASFD